MKKVLIILTVLATTFTQAQEKKELDKAAIKSMCGCYDVSFDFAETFTHTKDESYEPSPVKRTGGLEWVELLEDSEDKIVMQHLLIVGHEEQFIIKHWRQDWEFENQQFYMFDADAVWNPVVKTSEETKGQWTQRVFQVDDSPRYEGSASWVHVDGKSFWENTTDAPLPRREFSIRDDYNVMKRTNRHEIISSGWIHDQDNSKLLRTEGEDDLLLAGEKGINVYTKIDDEKCLTAQEWWKSNKGYWADVRSIWDEVFASKKVLKINFKIEDKIMFQRLFALGDDVAKEKKYKSKKVIPQIREIIQLHMKSDIRVVQN